MTKRMHPVLVAQRREEAELLRQCGKLAEVSIQLAALWQRRTTIEAEEWTDPELRVLEKRQAKIQRRIRSFHPTTDVGWTALARACMLDARIHGLGEVYCSEDMERVAWKVVAEVAGLPPPSL